MTKLVKVEREKVNREFQRVLRYSVSYPEIQEHLITNAFPQLHEFVIIEINIPKVTVLDLSCLKDYFSIRWLNQERTGG